MEAVCCLKEINNLFQSTMNSGSSDINSSSLNSYIFEKSMMDFSKTSSDNCCESNESSMKRNHSECVEDVMKHDDLKCVVSEGNIVPSDGVVFESSKSEPKCVLGNRSDNIVVEDGIADFRGEQISGMAKFNQQFMLKRNQDMSQLTCSKMVPDGKIRLLTVSRLDKPFNKTSLPGEINSCTRGVISPVGSDLKVKRCRSLPCSATPESKQEIVTQFPRNNSYTTSIRMSRPLSEDLFYNKEKINCSSIQELGSSEIDNDCVNQEGIYASRPATPSSCIIDVEDDMSPSSPLNLTINEHELHFNNSSTTEDTSNSSSHFYKIDESVLHINSFDTKIKKCIGENSLNEKLQEKKTNFSIDAILRPDFGAGRPASQTTSFQKNIAQSTTPRVRNTIKSFHSAFTAVDLSTRSRSDSLSSPSCSSSSPSPPLSTSSPSPRLKPDFNHVGIFDKHIGQENILFSTRFLQEPTKDFDNFINGHIPFINPLQANSLGNFPFLYPPQTVSHIKSSAERDSFRYQHAQENIISKSNELKNDISKLLNRSLYPFVNNPQHCRSDIIKFSRNHGNFEKTGSENTLNALRHNKPERNNTRDISSSVKSSTKNRIQEPSETKKRSRIQTSISNEDTDTSDNCKLELKDEKNGQNSDKSDDSSSKTSDGNQVWPAWVFCTRYSDRPSSGPRSRKPKRCKTQDEKRPRTAFTNDQLIRLKREFDDCRYLTESRRKSLADELGLTESQIKIWFQNKRAKIKKSVGVRNPLALQLMEQGLYNHSTVKLSDDSS